MGERRRVLAGVGLVAGIFLGVQLGALALVRPFVSTGYRLVENPSDPANSLAYFGAILVATAVMLVVLRYGGRSLLRLFIVVSAGFFSLTVLGALVPPVVAVAVGGGQVNVLAWLGAVAVAGGLLVYPEWWVIDASGVVMGAGAAGLFGVSFGLLPSLVLLVVLAVYDAISVYGTEHMLTLASGVMDMKVPVVLVIPLSLDYSFLAEFDGGQSAAPAADGPGTADGGAAGTGPAGDEESSAGEPAVADGEPAAGTDSPASVDALDEGPLDRDALFIGLGDAVIPTVLVVSAAVFLDVPSLSVPGVALNLPALTAMAGTFVGLAVLMWMVLKGRAHAGLPLLNGGAILGYLVGAVAAGVPLVTALGLAPYL